MKVIFAHSDNCPAVALPKGKCKCGFEQHALGAKYSRADFVKWGKSASKVLSPEARRERARKGGLAAAAKRKAKEST